MVCEKRARLALECAAHRSLLSAAAAKGEHHVRNRATVTKRAHAANCLRTQYHPAPRKLTRHDVWHAARRATHVRIECVQLRIRRRLAICEA